MEGVLITTNLAIYNISYYRSISQNLVCSFPEALGKTVFLFTQVLAEFRSTLLYD